MFQPLEIKKKIVLMHRPVAKYRPWLRDHSNITKALNLIIFSDLSSEDE